MVLYDLILSYPLFMVYKILIQWYCKNFQIPIPLQIQIKRKAL